MDEITFRPARASDLAAIVALLADDGLGRGREDPSLPLDQGYIDAFAAVEADPNQLLLVAIDGEEEELVGTLQLSFIPGITRKGAWRGQIEAVRVAAGRRGTGLGERMFAWAIAECRSRGCSLVQLTTDKERQGAHRFYERQGFVASHLGYKLSL